MSEEEVNTSGKTDMTTFEHTLRQVATEIDSLKSSFSKGTEDLSRIRNMLDVDAFKEISVAIQKFEGQINEIEKQREDAYEGAKKYSEELEKEKERLVKLWDAYKKQEAELSNIENKIQVYEEQVKTIEEEKQRIETDYSERVNTLTQKCENQEVELQKFADYEQQITSYQTTQEQLEQENQNCHEQIQQQNDTIQQLQQDCTKYKEYEKFVEFEEKYNEVSKAYEKEKERLTKLYHLYEETEGECKKLTQENEQWSNWFNENREIFSKLFSNAPPAPLKNPVNTKTNTETLEQTAEETFDTSETTTETNDKKRKKFLFKK